MPPGRNPLFRLCHSRCRTRPVCVFFSSDLEGVRTLLALAEWIWAATLFLPGVTFGRPTYKVMGEWGTDHGLSLSQTEMAVASIFLVMGTLQAALILAKDYHSRLATVFATINSSWWFAICYSMYASISPVPAGISGEAALCFGAFWVWVRTGLPCVGRRCANGR